MKENFFVHESSYIDDKVKIGEGTKIWHFSHIQSNAELGMNCSLGQNVNIGPNVKIGNNVKIQNNVSIYDGVIIEDDVFCGPSCVFTNVINPRSLIDRKESFKQTLVKKGATIGANATIVCGNEIGEYAMIGAGSVITKPVKAFSIVVGTPAKHIGWISRFGERLDDSLECKKSGEKYKIFNNNTLKIIKE